MRIKKKKKKTCALDSAHMLTTLPHHLCCGMFSHNLYVKCRENIVKSFIKEDVIQLEKVKMFQGSAKKSVPNQIRWSPAERSFGYAKDAF